MGCQKTFLFQEYVPLSRVLWLYGPTEQNASYCISTLFCSHKNNIYTHSSRAASHKFCFSHLELHVHTYSLNMHMSKKQQSSKIRDFFPREKASQMKYTGISFLLLVILYAMYLGSNCMHFLFVLYVLRAKYMHDFYVFQFDFSIKLFSINLFPVQSLCGYYLLNMLGGEVRALFIC